MLPITDAMRERWMDDRRELQAAQRESSEWNSVLNAGAPVNEWMLRDADDPTCLYCGGALTETGAGAYYDYEFCRTCSLYLEDAD